MVEIHVGVMDGRKILENLNFKAIEFLWSEFFKNYSGILHNEVEFLNNHDLNFKTKQRTLPSVKRYAKEGRKESDLLLVHI